MTRITRSQNEGVDDLSPVEKNCVQEMDLSSLINQINDNHAEGIVALGGVLAESLNQFTTQLDAKLSKFISASTKNSYVDNSAAVSRCSQPESLDNSSQANADLGRVEGNPSDRDEELSIIAPSTGQVINEFFDDIDKPTEVSLGEENYWDDIPEVYQEKTEFGPECLSSLSSAVKLMFTRPIPADKLSQLLDEAKIPANCQFMAVKKVNVPIWSRQDQKRDNDLNITKTQRSWIKSSTGYLELAQEISEAKEQGRLIDTKKMLGIIKSSLCIAGHANQLTNQYRRQGLIVEPSLSALRKDVPEGDTLLFGDDLEKRIVSIQNNQKLVSAVNKRSAPPQSSPGSRPSQSSQNGRHFSSQPSSKRPKKNQDGPASRQSAGNSKNYQVSSKTFPQRRPYSRKGRN